MLEINIIKICLKNHVNDIDLTLLKILKSEAGFGKVLILSS